MIWEPAASVFAVDSSFETPAFIYQTSRCHFTERGYCVSHHRENPILCIGSFRYESLPLVLRQEEKYILKRIEIRSTWLKIVVLNVKLRYLGL
jgi:hypothetical protein